MFLEDTNSIKVLCIEDEKAIRMNQVDYLSNFFQNVLEASDAKEALEIIQKETPQLIITDIEMPDMNGLEMIRLIREYNTTTKIIVLSAYSNKEYLLDAIDLGLVKYLIKPIDHETFYPILIQCIKEIKDTNSNLIQISEGCTFDTTNSKIYFNDQTFTLSKYETDFLLLLYNNRSNIVTYDQIQFEVWVDNIMSENSLRTLVKSLRKKLPKNIITNLSKVGYKLEKM